MRPLLLDLFCGAGGASVGYHRAGFDVIGVDIKRQPHYPFEFIQADALNTLRVLTSYEDFRWEERNGPTRISELRLEEFAAIHASPPCQRYSDLAGRNGNAHEHPDLVGPVRDLLEKTGLPYVIENVEGAPLIDPVMICGSYFDLGTATHRLRRHRLFETNWGLKYTQVCMCGLDPRPVIDVSGGGPQRSPRKKKTGGDTYKGTADERREAMGIDWMTRDELAEAIPPAYTEIIGRELREWID